MDNAPGLDAISIAEMTRSLKAERWATLARQAEASLVAAGWLGCSQCMRHAASLLESAESRDAARGVSSLVYLAQAVDRQQSHVVPRTRTRAA